MRERKRGCRHGWRHPLRTSSWGTRSTYTRPLRRDEGHSRCTWTLVRVPECSNLAQTSPFLDPAAFLINAGEGRRLRATKSWGRRSANCPAPRHRRSEPSTRWHRTRHYGCDASSPSARSLSVPRPRGRHEHRHHRSSGRRAQHHDRLARPRGLTDLGNLREQLGDLTTRANPGEGLIADCAGTARLVIADLEAFRLIALAGQESRG